MSDRLIVKMPPDCDLRSARALQGDLLAALDRASDVGLDCAAIERVDITFVQLVAAAARSSARRGAAIDLINLTERVESAFRRAGFTPHAPFLPTH